MQEIPFTLLTVLILGFKRGKKESHLYLFAVHYEFDTARVISTYMCLFYAMIYTFTFCFSVVIQAIFFFFFMYLCGHARDGFLTSKGTYPLPLTGWRTWYVIP